MKTTTEKNIVIVCLFIFSMLFTITFAHAQSVEQVQTKRIITGDTLDVSALKNVEILETVEAYAKIEVQVVAKGADASTVDRLSKSGYFNMQIAHTETVTTIKDHTDKAVFVNGRQMEDRRRYVIAVPKGVTVIK